MVIEPDANQRNDLLIVMNNRGETAMKIDADGRAWFFDTALFWSVETQGFVAVTLGGPAS